MWQFVVLKHFLNNRHNVLQVIGVQVAARLEMWRAAQRKALGIERREDLPELPQEEINSLKRNLK